MQMKHLQQAQMLGPQGMRNQLPALTPARFLCQCPHTCLPGRRQANLPHITLRPNAGDSSIHLLQVPRPVINTQEDKPTEFRSLAM